MFHLGVGDVLVYHDAIQDTGLLKGSSRDLWVQEGVVTVVGAVVECREERGERREREREREKNYSCYYGTILMCGSWQAHR